MLKKQYIFLLVSTLGIILLLILSQTLQPKITDINKITNNNLNQEIQIKAKIIAVKDYPQSSFQVLTLQDSTGKIKATSNSNKQLKITNNQTYLITGKLEENFYNNTRTLQLSIDKIEVYN